MPGRPDRPAGEPLLLISGTGAQMIIWPEDLCVALADRGFQVARFDNRDTGLSTHVTGTPAPGWLKTMLRPSAAPYRLDDMAEDAVAVMDALGWPTAHLDPIIRPKGGRSTAQAIPGARLVTYPAWATTCPGRYGRPSWRRFLLWRVKPGKRSTGRLAAPPARR
jgi:hypothetical protein